tara:strand:- start:441 stop:902 length:462 start_codon:yes stop_codon:yes gene_type:complete
MSHRHSGIGEVTHPFASREDNLMLSLLRIITVLSGLGLFLIGVIWWLQPATAAEMLGASLLDGTGRSTQVGDSGAFFIGAGGLLSLGAIRNHAALVISGGLLVGLVIPGRVLSATTHGGAWTPDKIAGECIVLVVALLTAAAIHRQNAQTVFR